MTRTKAIFWILVLTLLMCMSEIHCYAQTEDMAGYPPECVQLFQSMDTDHDRQVTLEEYALAAPTPTYAGRKMAKETFLAKDKNGDGVITIDEFCIVRELKEGEKEPTPEEQCEEQFKKCNVSGSGKLNLTEFFNCMEAKSYGSRKSIKDTFILLDKNHDEELTQEEFCADAPPPATE